MQCQYIYKVYSLIKLLEYELNRVIENAWKSWLQVCFRICITKMKERNVAFSARPMLYCGVLFSLNISELPLKCAFLLIQVDRYEGTRSLDDLKNYLTLKISEHSLLSSAITEKSESAEEVPSDATDMETQVIKRTFQTGTTSLFTMRFCPLKTQLIVLKVWVQCVEAKSSKKFKLSFYI